MIDAAMASDATPCRAGQFYLVNLVGVVNAEGEFLQLTRIDCPCLECRRQFAATVAHGLVELDGAAVLACPRCQNRRAISRVRLKDFRLRVG